MRFMVLVKASDDSEAGHPPPAELIDKMMRFNLEMVKAGVMLAADGLQPSSKGARITFSGKGKPTVVDGPFAETKELVAGYWMIQAKSKEEAIEWISRSPFTHGETVEIRQVFEMDDFPSDVVTPEAVALEAEMHAHMAQKTAQEPKE